ncbi:MAG: protein-L-isoaspartate(D-aspartate) O-methyltransferase [Gammaproteobacteria bacterium]|nr:protein-L-isoaspartate(D-aspartate) O-methyltransferase [Gammaproteobacteria bacterium]
MPRNVKGIGMTSQRTRDRLVQRLREEGISDERVLSVIGSTPRHLFVDEALSHRAYEDTALPIGHSQTISQPYVVALMTQALLADGVPQKVLEIGTGSGYQAAILAQLVPRLYSVERIRALHDRSRNLLRDLRINNAQLYYSDGSWGLKQCAPFDAIIVTAAPEEIPQALLEQLAVGGRMVIPVGEGHGIQQLLKITRTPTQFEKQLLEAVSFVPLRKGES